jgi:hypothetical protein
LGKGPAADRLYLTEPSMLHAGPAHGALSNGLAGVMALAHAVFVVAWEAGNRYCSLAAWQAPLLSFFLFAVSVAAKRLNGRLPNTCVTSACMHTKCIQVQQTTYEQCSHPSHCSLSQPSVQPSSPLVTKK